MTIYLDIVFLENLCMNYIILFATGTVIKIKMKQIRIVLSAGLGSTYAILIYMNINTFYSNMAMKIILSLCMIYIAFIPKSWKVLLKELIIFYLISFAFGGCAFALLYFLKPQNILYKNGVYIGTYPLKIALLGGIIGFVIVYLAFRIVKNKINRKALVYEIDIKIGEKNTMVKAILDTGNMLKDPITGTPVIIVEKECLKEILSDNILDNIDNIIKGDWKGCDKEIEYRARFRMIPFQSVGKRNGMLLGFKADEIIIKTEMEDILKKNIIIGIYNDRFTKNNAYSALIGLEIIGRSEENEHFTNIKV